MREELLKLALSDRYSMVLCYDIKTANIYKKAGVPPERVFTKSSVKDRSKGKMVAPPYYMIVDNADLLLGYFAGQPIGVMGIDEEVD